MMIIHKSYKFRLKPTEEQIAMLKQHGGNSRFVWNKLLEFSKAMKDSIGKYPNQSFLQKYIIKLKDKNEFVSISHSQPIQINAMRLAKTYSRAFSKETVSKRNKAIAMANAIVDPTQKAKKLAIALEFGFPKFKRKNQSRDSIFYPQNFIIKKSRIHFPKLGWIDYIKHRNIEGKPISVTITQDGSQYYVSIASEVEIKEKTKKKVKDSNIVGIDVGLTTFATLSDGSEIQNPRHLNKHLKKLRKINRKLARQELEDTGTKTLYGKEIKKSSNRRNKTIVHLQNLHRKVRNIRKDFLYKTVHHIITKYDGIALETLDIKGLLQINKKDMNKSISDNCGAQAVGF